MLLSPCTTPASATTTLTVPNPTQGFGASALSDWHTGWLVGDALAPAPAATEPLVPHLPHPMAPQGDLPLSPSEPLIISSPPPHPCPTRPSFPQHPAAAVPHPRVCGQRAQSPVCCRPLLFPSCVTQQWWDPAAPSGLLRKIPNKKNVLIPSFPEVFQEVCCARDTAGCGVCCPVTLGAGPVWFSP